MEDTIGSNGYGPMGQVFRITYKKTDFQIKLIKGSPSKIDTEIQILLDGLVQTLVKKDDKWCFAEVNGDQEFANDIGRAIALRYRI